MSDARQHKYNAGSMIMMALPVLLLLLIGCSAPAEAYLNPATGSIMIQVLLASVVALAMGWRAICLWVGALVKGLTRRDSRTP